MFLWSTDKNDPSVIIKTHLIYSTVSVKNHNDIDKHTYENLKKKFEHYLLYFSYTKSLKNLLPTLKRCFRLSSKMCS